MTAQLVSLDTNRQPQTTKSQQRELKWARRLFGTYLMNLRSVLFRSIVQLDTELGRSRKDAFNAAKIQASTAAELRAQDK
jgi:hypothetical protein